MILRSEPPQRFTQQHRRPPGVRRRQPVIEMRVFRIEPGGPPEHARSHRFCYRLDDLRRRRKHLLPQGSFGRRQLQGHRPGAGHDEVETPFSQLVRRPPDFSGVGFIQFVAKRDQALGHRQQSQPSFVLTSTLHPQLPSRPPRSQHQ